MWCACSSLQPATCVCHAASRVSNHRHVQQRGSKRSIANLCLSTSLLYFDFVEKYQSFESFIVVLKLHYYLAIPIISEQLAAIVHTEETSTCSSVEKGSIPERV